MISKKSAVSATRHGLDARRSKMPRKMNESVSVSWCGEAAPAPSPHIDTVQWVLFFVLPVATTVIQRTLMGEKSFLQPPGVSMGAPPGLLHTLQLVCVEGLIFCPLGQVRDASVLPSTSAWGLTPVTAPRLAVLFYCTQANGFSSEGREELKGRSLVLLSPCFIPCWCWA